MNLEFSRKIFGKYSHINFMKIPPVEAELFMPMAGHTGKRTYIHDEASSRFSQLFERTK